MEYWEEENYIGPASEPQRKFMVSDCDYILFGGAAGSGKSFVALMSLLQYIDDPYFRGVVFRRNMGEIDAGGGLWETAIDLYTKFIHLHYPKGSELKVGVKAKTLTFPSGASIKFTHLDQEKTKFSHQGAQYVCEVFDEATHFSQSMIEYLGTRLRSAKCKYKPHVRMTCNPDYDSFLREWVEPYLDPETGIPDRSKDGMVRYFVVEDGKYIWADDRKELEKVYGTGPDSGILSFTFISGTCEDNPPLLRAQPDYVSRLKAKPRIEVQRLLYGSWYARETASGYWKEEWCKKSPFPPSKTKRRCRAWDISGSVPSEQLRNPDWTAGVLLTEDDYGQYYVEDVVRFRDRYLGVEEKIIQTAHQDGHDTTIVIPQDPGAAGKAYASSLVKKLSALGYRVRVKTTNKSKIMRFAPFASVSEAGLVTIVTGEWNDDYIQELEAFSNTRNQKEDQVDATSDAWWCISSTVHIPDFLGGMQSFGFEQVKNPLTSIR